jgi:hypothetical protein
MDAILLDAAFRLVSHSLSMREARVHPLVTDEARLAELGRQFPDADPQAVLDAYARAHISKRLPSRWRTWWGARWTASRGRR